LIVDFIGIFDNLQRALAFDSTDIDGIYENIDSLRCELKKLIERVKMIIYQFLQIFLMINKSQNT